MLPVSGYAAIKVGKKGLMGLIILVITLILIIPIAAHDPNVSPIEYAKIHHTPLIQQTRSDYLEGFLFMSLLKPSNDFALIIYSRPILITYGYSPSMGLWPEYTNVPTGVIGAVSFIMNRTTPLMNIAYNYTGQYVYYYVIVPPNNIPQSTPADLVFSASYRDLRIFIKL